MIFRAPAHFAHNFTVGSSALIPSLNADLLDGYHASAFAASSHEHSATAITSDVLAAARLATEAPNLSRFVGYNGSEPVWKQPTIADIAGVSDLGANLCGASTDAVARSILDAAQTYHTHNAIDITAGVFRVARLAPMPSSPSKYLAGHSLETGQAQWKQIHYSEVFGAVGYSAGTAGRITYWAYPGVLADSPLVVGSGQITTTNDFGTTGVITGNDLVVNYAAAEQFKSSVYNKVKATLVGGSNVSITPNDGLQTLTIASTATGVPTLPVSDGAYVLVIASGVAYWRQLVGTA